MFDWSKYAVGGAKRPDSFTGLNPNFSTALSQMLQAAEAELGQNALSITSAYRSPEKQAELYQAALKKYGSPAAARKWVAPPGRSMHNKGLAVDFGAAGGGLLRDPNSREAQWLKANASRFGLDVPMSWEPWQVELAGARGGKKIAAETMRLLGKGPQTATTGTQGAAPMMQQEQKPRGLLGSLGIQKMEEGAEGETGQRFYNRDSFKDTAATLAQGFGRMGIMGMEEIADSVAKQRTEVKAKNKTMEMLSKLPNGEHLMRVAEIAGAKAAVDLYVSEQKGGGVGGVQSSSALADQSGVVLTLRDGSIQVKTAGGQTLSGQEAMDFVRKSQENAANLQRDINRARREGTNIAEAETGAAAAGAGKSGELTMERGFKAYDDAVKAGNALSTMDEAIAALDSGAKSGIVYNMLPNVTEASASLSNAMNRMGLDVISSVTFGALSEAEMKLAMETAVPRGLAPDELRSWLVKKRDAQAKAREALMSAARYLTQPGNNLSGWMEKQANAPAAAPTPTGGGAARLKFNPETGELESLND